MSRARSSSRARTLLAQAARASSSLSALARAQDVTQQRRLRRPRWQLAWVGRWGMTDEFAPPTHRSLLTHVLTRRERVDARCPPGLRCPPGVGELYSTAVLIYTRQFYSHTLVCHNLFTVSQAGTNHFLQYGTGTGTCAHTVFAIITAPIRTAELLHPPRHLTSHCAGIPTVFTLHHSTPRSISLPVSHY